MIAHFALQIAVFLPPPLRSSMMLASNILVAFQFSQDPIERISTNHGVCIRGHLAGNRLVGNGI